MIEFEIVGFNTAAADGRLRVRCTFMFRFACIGCSYATSGILTKRDEFAGIGFSMRSRFEAIEHRRVRQTVPPRPRCISGGGTPTTI